MLLRKSHVDVRILLYYCFVTEISACFKWRVHVNLVTRQCFENTYLFVDEYTYVLEKETDPITLKNCLNKHSIMGVAT